MKEELVKQILTLMTGGVLGVVFKYWYDYKGMVHKELWIKRYEKYQAMFLLAGKFPLYPKKSVVTYYGLLRTSEGMRDWFFKDGGILLSTKTRNKYFKVQRAAKAILDNMGTKPMDQDISGSEYDSIRQLLSQFRKAMTDDLMSRHRV